MKAFKYERRKGKYQLHLKLLSFRTPFEFIDEMNMEIPKYIQNGLIFIDETEHNDSPEKRFLEVRVRDGKIQESTFKFVVDDMTQDSAE